VVAAFRKTKANLGDFFEEGFKVLVVKVGGSLGIDYDAVCEDLVSIVKSGTKAILVHGGSAETNRISEKLGKPPRMVVSASGFESRYTDRETLEIFEMVYCGKMNKGIVERLQRKGVNAVGLSGLDGRILEGIRKSSITIIEGGKKRVLRGDLTGRVQKVNVTLLRLLLDNGFTPVLTPPAISHEGVAINVDGDRAAAILAAALKVDKLVILSNVPGLLRNVQDAETLIDEIRYEEAEKFMRFAQGRMKKKVLGAIEAIREGVKEVVFADARITQPITAALQGKGTVIH
jgi:acetylglutamate/LysW-gamma-L-alpha-aminoadipate kinase